MALSLPLDSRGKQLLELVLLVCSHGSLHVFVNTSDGSKGRRIIRITSNVLILYHGTISFATSKFHAFSYLLTKILGTVRWLVFVRRYSWIAGPSSRLSILGEVT